MAQRLGPRGPRHGAQGAARALSERRDALEAELKVLLLPKDPNDEKNVILEIRAGAGGDEAGLFAEEVLQMYLRYADRKGWKAELVDMSAGQRGRHQGRDRHPLRRRRLLVDEVRVRRAPGAARARPPRPRGASTPPPSPWR